MNNLKLFLLFCIALLFLTACAYDTSQASAIIETEVQETQTTASAVQEIKSKPASKKYYNDYHIALNSYLSNKLNREKNDILLADIKVFKISYKLLDHIEVLKNSTFYKGESSDESLNIRNAIIRFQSSLNEPIKGELTKLDKNIINMGFLNKLSSDIDRIDDPPTDKKWMTINKTTRILTLYEDDKIVKKYPVAIGKDPRYTPTGKFSIVVMVKNPSWGGGGYAAPVSGGSPSNPLGYRWMGLSINDGGTYGIHGSNMQYSIGTNASHGCIRMINYDVEELYDIIPMGTIVWIGDTNNLEEWGITQDIYKVSYEK